MTVNAADLAGNNLLLLPTAKTTINSSEITRNNSSGFFPDNAGAASVDFTKNFNFSLFGNHVAALIRSPPANSVKSILTTKVSSP